MRVRTCKELRAKHDQTNCYLRPPFLGTPLVPSRIPPTPGAMAALSSEQGGRVLSSSSGQGSRGSVCAPAGRPEVQPPSPGPFGLPGGEPEMSSLEGPSRLPQRSPPTGAPTVLAAPADLCSRAAARGPAGRGSRRAPGDAAHSRATHVAHQGSRWERFGGAPLGGMFLGIACLFKKRSGPKTTCRTLH